jgi:insertion element IS1 protein InsB
LTHRNPVELKRVDDVEFDEMWSFVKSKKKQRWLWHTIDHDSGTVLAYVLGYREDSAFLRLKKLLKPFGIKNFGGGLNMLLPHNVFSELL